MLNTILIILAVLAALVGGVVAYASTRPDTLRVERAATVNAPAEKVFPLINDLHAFNGWNPFAKQDPGMTLDYSGPAAGKGAAFTFGGGSGGKGRIEILDSVPASKVEMRLAMFSPMEADNRVNFTLRPEGNATRVSWTMEGGVPLVAKVMHLFINIDRMVGGTFEQGLAELKATAERG
jgi:hypothetical protein